MVRKLSALLVLILLGILLSTSGAGAYELSTPLFRPLAAPLGIGFNYQGYLTDGGSPADGAYDFEFELYDDPSAGSQVGSTVPKDDVVVTDGYFTVELDFGSVFDGTALWLDIAVRPGVETGAYTALSPRQPLSPAPYASFASAAPWSGLSGVPAGFADDVDDDTTYTPGEGLNLVANEFSVDYAGTGSAGTAARSDHDHDGTYATVGSVTALDTRVGTLETELQAIGGQHDTPTNDGITLIPYPFTFDISGLGPNVDPADVRVVANGFKKAADGTPLEPILIRWSVAGTTLTLHVWDANGVEFTSTAPVPSAWLNRRVELSIVVVRHPYVLSP